MSERIARRDATFQPFVEIREWARRRRGLIPPAARKLASFGLIGIVSTLAYAIAFSVLRAGLPATGANALALVLTAVGNTAANRRLTFGVRGADGLARDHAAGLLAFGLALLITSGAITLLAALWPAAGRSLELLILVGANGAATVLRFVILRRSIGRSGDRPVANA